ncbi:nudix hydrolase [Luminiphilus syltensis NOR5-1B]|uniref:Phosphatase NudJ n=1 Tax=Luminiphilus syltensis NOR5-1B TaxID=565045 RepID=B8KRL6_9GAMM|nr:NUDIX hydrolase [Luminiphilus syltensis]EED34128.1 nudix hydrolase [Luminiphilus syltensis NOR5-1B]
MIATIAQDSPRWRPNATVAAVIADGDRFLLVEESDPSTGATVFNQPAGHLEPGEGLIAAVEREVLEETRWHCHVSNYLGVALYTGGNGVTYLRHTFVATALTHDPTKALDPSIIAVHWFSLDEIRHRSQQLRSPLVYKAIEQFIKGQWAPLSLVVDL